MAKRKQKYYVVWIGAQPGVYNSWEQCKKQVDGLSGARYKSFGTEAEAWQAFHAGPAPAGMESPQPAITSWEHLKNKPETNAIAVDAACSGNPGVMEYQGVYVESRTPLFHFKSPIGTNNIGEFLAIVHGLSFIKKERMGNVILYSDSANAIAWVNAKRCRTKLALTQETAQLFEIIRRAEVWLQNNSYTTEIRKWDTHLWGEIPADFGRK
ncbi:MAG: ribonuclease H family protein [Bacteroidales bacterium]|nr:ribonuclease H family protein [Bacteroidales bacterium]